MTNPQTPGATPAQWNIYTSRSAYTAEVAEIIWRAGHEVGVLIDNMPGGPQPSDLGPVVTPAEIGQSERARPTVLALMTPGHRFQIAAEATAHGLSHFPSLVDPTAAFARTATIAQGSVINAMAVVAARSTIGQFVHVNRSVSIGHDALIDDYVTFGPGCILAGFITIGRGAFIGAGAVIAPNVTIGSNTTIGAGAVVVRDVPANCVVVGNPGRVIRDADAGFDGVSVP